MRPDSSTNVSRPLDPDKIIKWTNNEAIVLLWNAAQIESLAEVKFLIDSCQISCTILTSDLLILACFIREQSTADGHRFYSFENAAECLGKLKEQLKRPSQCSVLL